MKSYLTVKQMEALSTPRLLAYRKKLMEARYAPEDEIWGCRHEECKAEVRRIEHREAVIAAAKKILNTREHVERVSP
jgi:hypothetical protein